MKSSAQQSLMHNRLRDIIRRIMLAISACALVVLLLESVLRLVFDNAYFTPPVFTSSGDEVGYALKPGAIADVHQFGRKIHVSIDGHGHRTTPGAVSRPLRLHVIGDSQVFGWGLSDNETIPALIQRTLGPQVQVVNHGVPGFGPMDYIRVLSGIPPQELVLLVYTEENDMWDAFIVFRRAASSCDYIVSSFGEGLVRCLMLNARSVQWTADAWEHLSRHATITPIGFSDDSLAAGKVLLERINFAYASERMLRGTRLLSTVVPWKGRYSKSWRQQCLPPARESIGEESTPFPDAVGMTAWFARERDPDALYLPGDPHLSPLGARRFAEAVLPLVSARLTEPLKPTPQALKTDAQGSVSVLCAAHRAAPC